MKNTPKNTPKMHTLGAFFAFLVGWCGKKYTPILLTLIFWGWPSGRHDFGAAAWLRKKTYI